MSTVGEKSGSSNRSPAWRIATLPFEVILLILLMPFDFIVGMFSEEDADEVTMRRRALKLAAAFYVGTAIALLIVNL